MNSEKMKGDYERTREVILSCQNMNQLKVGIKMYNQLNKLHELPEKDLNKLENLIGLMKIKCNGGDIIEERSSVRSPSLHLIFIKPIKFSNLFKSFSGNSCNLFN